LGFFGVFFVLFCFSITFSLFSAVKYTATK
jgi:hypothetical protein